MAPDALLSLGPATGIKQLVYDGSLSYNSGFGADLFSGKNSLDIFAGYGTGADTSINFVMPTSAWPYAGFSAKMTILENGDVGINRAAPGRRLDVYGDLPAGAFNVGVVGAAGAARDILLAGEEGYSNGFTVQYNGSSMVYGFNNGNVGIGTSSPAWPLEVAAFGARIVTPTSNAAQFDLVEPQGGHDWALISWGSAAAGGTIPGRFSIYDNTVGANRVLIDTAGNVGIGTQSPQSLLDVNGSATIEGNATIVGTLTATGGLAGVSSGPLTLAAGGTDQNVTITPSGTGATVVNGQLQAKNGMQISPAASGPSLSVTGQMAGSQSLFLSTSSASAWVGPSNYNTATPGIFVQTDAGHARMDLLAPGGNGDHPVMEGVLVGGTSLSSIAATPQNDQFVTRMVTYDESGSSGYNYNTSMVMQADGNISQGDHSTSIRFYTNTASGNSQEVMRLNAQGIVEAQEVLVQPQGSWSDYVFSPNYRLAPLSEVAKVIATENHLPGIPSAEDVAKHGIKTGEMEAKLLAKIEELTLHAIAQEKRMDRLEAENSELRSELLAAHSLQP